LPPADTGAARPIGASALALEGITAGYSRVPVVRDVSMDVRGGEITLIVGPNGAGKSTLVKAVIGELQLLGGRITFDGVDITGWGEERRAKSGFGYVPQLRDVFPTLSVVENLEVGAYRLGSRATRQAIAEMLERFPQLHRLRRRKASQLSGGERKLLAIARGLIANPRLLILDEPTANLAPKIAHDVLENVVVELAALGHGILLIEQRVALASRIAAHVTVLVDGGVRYSGTGEEFRALPDVGAVFFSPRPDEPANQEEAVQLPQR
jgi:ABC-type branched-subunit amino acid transport system ATPase component